MNSTHATQSRVTGNQRDVSTPEKRLLRTIAVALPIAFAALCSSAAPPAQNSATHQSSSAAQSASQSASQSQNGTVAQLQRDLYLQQFVVTKVNDTTQLNVCVQNLSKLANTGLLPVKIRVTSAPTNSVAQATVLVNDTWQGIQATNFRCHTYTLPASAHKLCTTYVANADFFDQTVDSNKTNNAKAQPTLCVTQIPGLTQ
jgi:hypothetical protein